LIQLCQRNEAHATDNVGVVNVPRAPLKGAPVHGDRFVDRDSGHLDSDGHDAFSGDAQYEQNGFVDGIANDGDDDACHRHQSFSAAAVIGDDDADDDDGIKASPLQRLLVMMMLMMMMASQLLRCSGYW